MNHFLNKTPVVDSLKKIVDYIWIVIVILYVFNEYFWTVAAYITYNLFSDVPIGVVNFFHFFINFDFEYNIPTILSTLLLISCSFLIIWLIRLKT